MLMIWAVALTSSGCLAWVGSTLGVFHLATVVIFNALMGIWATLQFTWIYREWKEEALLLERCGRVTL